MGNWFIDQTPDADEEFDAVVSAEARGRFDLLSTLIHEQGHVLGLGDLYGQKYDVMGNLLDAGTRRLPFAGQASGAIAGAITGEQFLTANIVRASTDSAGSQALGGASEAPSISADGRYVVFESDANNLVAGDSNFDTDVFVKDLHTGVVALVSSDSAGTQGNGDSFAAVISADGRFVAFSSEADNLVAGDTNNETDIFVKDLTTGTLSRVNTSSTGTESNDLSALASISADGRYVAFQSAATNLVAGDTNAVLDIFVKDLRRGTLERVSTAGDGSEGDGASLRASISADGRHVAFDSAATNLIDGDTNGAADIFVKNLRSGAVTRASTDASGVEASGASLDASLSADGSAVAFVSFANNLVTGDTNSISDIFFKDLRSGDVVRASTSSAGGQANGIGSNGAAISADGRFVAFSSWANNLVPSDSNGTFDIFVKEIATGTTTRLSTSNTGVQGGGHSQNPAISADGRFVAFDSLSSDLVGGDSNAVSDVFVKGISSLTGAYTTSVEIDAVGNLVITDIDGSDTDDNLFVGVKDGRLEISDKRATVGTSLVGSTLVGNKGRGVSIDLGAFTGNVFISTNGGDDTVTIGDLNGLPGGIAVFDGAGHDVTIQDGVMMLTGAGLVDYRTNEIRLNKGSEIHTEDGNIILLANDAADGTGRFTGVSGNGSRIVSDTGIIDIRGKGGTSGGGNRGVFLKNTEVMTGGYITIQGTGGTGTGSGNVGVLIDSGSEISTTGSFLEVIGIGGNAGRSSNVGVQIRNADLSITGAGIFQCPGHRRRHDLQQFRRRHSRWQSVLGLGWADRQRHRFDHRHGLRQSGAEHQRGDAE